MDPNNPYAAPQVTLIDEQTPPRLVGWNSGKLQMLGWLSLASIVVTLLALVAAFLGGDQPGSVADTAADWLSLVSTLLGCYLLLRLRAFLEQRFSAKGLLLPIVLTLLFSLLAEGMDWVWGDSIYSSLGWQTLVFFAVFVLMGLTTLWLGIALLRIRSSYPVLRVMAWLEIVGGVMFASVVLVLVALIPLLGASLAMALLFFRGAGELQGQQAA